MKVKELIEALKKENQKMEILLSSDDEGNNFGNVGEGFGIHSYEGKEILAIYPADYIDGGEVGESCWHCGRDLNEPKTTEKSKTCVHCTE